MGRPSRKRPRPPPPSLADISIFDGRKPRKLLPSTVSRFEEWGSIQSLVKGPHPKNSSCNPGWETTTTTASVQQVWGAFDKADITATTVAPGRSSGACIDVDDAGIAWLLHTPRQTPTDRDRCTGLSETDCSQPRHSSLGPQRRQAASTASTSTAGADSGQATPLDPPCPAGNPRSATDCTSSIRQEDGEEDARRPFCVCNAAVRAELSRVKGEFDDIPPAVFKRARSACNPAEALGSGLFLNRSAMKLANIDAVAGLWASCSGSLPVGRVAGQQGVDGVAGETRRVGGGNCRIIETPHVFAAAAAAAADGDRDEKCRQQQRRQQRQHRGEEETDQQRQEEKEQKQQQQRQQQQQQQHQQPQHQEQQQQQQEEEQQQQLDQGKERLGEQPRHGSPPPPFLFADLCGGPGGFSEYLLLRRRQLGLSIRGWGISLRGGSAGPNPAGCQMTGNDRGGRSTASGNEIAKSHDVHAEHGGARWESGTGKLRHGQCSEDPCAWRLDHLSPWCDVSTETVEPAKSTSFCRGLVDRSAISGDVRGTSGGRACEEIAHSESLESLAVGEDPETNAYPPARDASVCGGEDGGRVDRLGEHGRVENRGVDAVAAVYDGSVCEPRIRQPRLNPVAAAVPATDTAGTTYSPAPAPRPAPPPTTVAATAAGTAAAAAINNCSGGAAPTATRVTAPPVLEMRLNYGPAGTGDLADEENMYGFVDAVFSSTEGRRLDLVVADGGIEAARDSEEQERLMTPLVHAEALTALLLLAEGGSFVCKLFEVWTEPTASLVYLLHRRFRRIAIVKPITSRPASGERYVVCVGLLPPSLPTGCRFTDNLRARVHALQRRSGLGSPYADTSATDDFLSFQTGNGGNGSGRAAWNAVADRADVMDVALEMKGDGRFLSFLRLSNDRLANLQTEACARIIDVASSKRGRAWAFRDSKGRGGDRRGGIAPGVGEGQGEGEKNGVEEGGKMNDEAALQCFREAWRLDELEGTNPR